MKKTFMLLLPAMAGAVLLLASLSPAGGPLSVPEAAADAAKNPFTGNAAAVREGEKIFDAKCADCHGGDATGGAGPDLTDDRWIYGGSDAEVFASVSSGRKGGMPSWSGELKHDDIWKVIAYIRSLHR
jgi:cytochrome c oxidase cbb3-type subunit III